MLPLFQIPSRRHKEITLDLARRSTEVATCISKLIDQGETSSLVEDVSELEEWVSWDLIFRSNSTWARTLQRIYAFIKSKIRIWGWYEWMDDTTNWCRMFKNQLDLLLEKFKVRSEVITKSIRGLTLFFAHCSFYADTSPTRGKQCGGLYFKN